MPYHNHKANGSGKTPAVRSVAKTGSSTKSLRPQSGTRDAVPYPCHNVNGVHVGSPGDGKSQGFGGRGPIGS